MITTIPSPAPDRLRHRRGFTLVELLISASLGSLLLVAVLTGFLFMIRSGANMQNYVDMEVQARGAIATFAADVRMANNATWHSANSLTLRVVESNGTTSNHTYTYDPIAGTFTRSSGTSSTTLITGISNFSFTAYQINATALDLTDSSNLTIAGNLTKQVQISLRTFRSTRTVTDATNSVISARFILRNKRATA